MNIVMVFTITYLPLIKSYLPIKTMNIVTDKFLQDKIRKKKMVSD